jgi:hypothetical protein
MALAALASATVSGELVQLIKLMGAYDTSTEPNADFPFEYVEWIRYELCFSLG